MNESTDQEIVWHRPCESHACAEVARLDDDVFLRSSERPEEMIRLSAAEWDVLKDSIRRGDLPV